MGSEFGGIGIGFRGDAKLRFLSEEELLFPSGNGVSRLHIEERTGSFLPCDGGGISSVATAPYFSSAIANILGGSGVLTNGPAPAIAQNSTEALFAFGEAANLPGQPPRVIVMRGSEVLQTLVDDHEDISIASLDFSRDGSLLAVLTGAPSFMMTIWDWEEGIALIRGKCEVPCSTIQFNDPSAELIITAGQDGGYIWHFTRVQDECFLDCDEVKLDTLYHQCSSVCWLPNDTLVVGLENGQLLLISGKTGKRILKDPEHPEEGELPPIVVAPEEVAITCMVVTLHHIVCGCADGGLRWILFSDNSFARTFETIPDTLPAGASITTVSIAPSRRALCFGTNLSTIHTLLIPSDLLANPTKEWFGEMHPPVIYRAHNAPVVDVTPMIAAPLVCSADEDGMVFLWDLRTFTIAASFSLRPTAASATAGANTNSVGGGTQDGASVVSTGGGGGGNIASPKMKQGSFRSTSGNIEDLLVAPNSTNRRLSATSSASEKSGANGTTKSGAGGANVLPFDPITCVGSSQLGRLLAVGDAGGRVTLIDFASLIRPRIVFREKMHDGAVRRVRWHPDQGMLATVGDDKFLTFLAASDDSIKILGRTEIPAKPLDMRWGVMGELVESEDEDMLINVTHVLISTEDGGFHMISAPEPDYVPRQDLVFSQGNMKTVTMQSPALMFVLALANVEGTAMVIFVYSESRRIRRYEMAGMDFLQTSLVLVTASEPSPLLGSGLCLSFDGTMLAATDRGGFLRVFQSNDLSQAETTRMHLGEFGGASGVAFTEDDGTVVSIGFDNAVIAHALQPEGVLLPEDTPLALAEESAVSLVREVKDPFDPAPQRSVFARALEEGSLMASQGGSRLPGGSSLIHTKLHDLREMFLQALQANKNAPDIEKLDENEFVVDLEMRDKLLEDAQQRVKLVEEQVKLENLGRELVCHRIRKECVDALAVPSLAIQPMAPHGGQEVNNYPLLHSELGFANRAARLMMLRKIENKANEGIGGGKTMAGIVLTEAQQQRAMERAAELQRKRDAGEEIDEEAHLAGDDQDDDEDGTWQGDDSNPKYILYPAFELTTVERKLFQIYYLQIKIRDLQRQFNSEVQAMLQVKTDELNRIQEKVGRLEEIEQELKTDQRESLFIPTMQPSEEPGSILVVHDSELQSERFIPEEERAERERQRLLEEERMKNADVAGVKRALDLMMGGSLEVAKLNEFDTLEKPDFLDTMDADTVLSEEQIKIMKEYEKKLKLLVEEKEKQRKVLEAEAKKLRREIEEICEQFDERLRGLWEKRLAHRGLVDALELQVVLLAEDINTESDLLRLIQKASLDVDILEAKVKAARDEYDGMKKRVDAFREEYESALVEDKQLEKKFRREFADHVEVYDALFKLFKKRKYAAKENKNSRLMGDVALDPFVAAASQLSNDDPLPLPDPLDMDEDMPEGLESDVWERVVEVRNEKIQLEMEIKRKALLLAEWNRKLQGLADRESAAQESFEEAMAHLDELRHQHDELRRDLRVLVRLKQGQLEVNSSGNFTNDDLVDAVLIDRQLVERHNRTISQFGREKVGVMVETKDFKRKIHVLRWENAVFDAKSMNTEEDTRSYQLLRVTKSLQEMIKGGKRDKNAAEVATLEKQLEHLKDLHEVRVEEKKRKLFKVHRSIREKELENEKLDEYVQDLAVSVAQRDKIVQVRASEMETGEEREYRMQELVWRRLVLEEARQQSEDIDILKSEVDRMRQRTFPSFAKGQKNITR